MFGWIRAVGTAVLILLLIQSCARSDVPDQGADDGAPWAGRREAMVLYQLEARGIEDPRVLAAFREVPRHLLVPEDYRELAYTDRPLPIGWGQTISQPFIVAFMTEQLRLEGDERVLEVGTGSGYQAAILAELAREVFTIEIVPELATRAVRDLVALGYQTVHVREGDGYRGWPQKAPFDAIVVTAAPDHVPQPLLDQLAPGGRLILPRGEQGSVQQLVLITRDKSGQLQEQELLDVRFVPMTGEAEGDPDR